MNAANILIVVATTLVCLVALLGVWRILRPLKSSATHASSEARRRWIFTYDLAVVLVLAALLVSYFHGTTDWWAIRQYIPEALRGTGLRAVWLGAMGGVVISLKGIYDHDSRTWVDRFDLWHLGRPVSGAIAGGMTFVLLQAVAGQAPSQVVVEAAAFILGTQEARFFQLLSEVARLLVQVPEPPAAPLTVVGVRPSEAPAGSSVTVTGTGFDRDTTLSLIDDGKTYRLTEVTFSSSDSGSTLTATVPVVEGGIPAGNLGLLAVNRDGRAYESKVAFKYQRRLQGVSATIDFGTRHTGDDMSLNVELSNGSELAPLTVTEVDVSGPFAVTSAAPCTLQPAAKLSLTLTVPAPAPGTLSGELTVKDEDGTLRIPVAAKIV